MKSNKVWLLAGVCGLLIAVAFAIGFGIGWLTYPVSTDIDEKADSSSIASLATDAGETDAELLHPSDIGADSIRITFLRLEGSENMLVRLTPEISTATIEKFNATDTTFSLSSSDVNMLIRSIDSLYLSKTSKLCDEVIDIDIEHTYSSPYIVTDIYAKGRKMTYNINPAELISGDKAYVFSNPAYRLIQLVKAISYDAQHPDVAPQSRYFAESRTDLMESLDQIFYPDSIPKDILDKITAK